MGTDFLHPVGLLSASIVVRIILILMSLGSIRDMRRRLAILVVLALRGVRGVLILRLIRSSVLAVSRLCDGGPVVRVVRRGECAVGLFPHLVEVKAHDGSDGMARLLLFPDALAHGGEFQLGDDTTDNCTDHESSNDQDGVVDTDKGDAGEDEGAKDNVGGGEDSDEDGEDGEEEGFRLDGVDNVRATIRQVELILDHGGNARLGTVSLTGYEFGREPHVHGQRGEDVDCYTQESPQQCQIGFIREDRKESLCAESVRQLAHIGNGTCNGEVEDGGDDVVEFPDQTRSTMCPLAKILNHRVEL